jgi:4-hydroxybenzoate polyprenyltransferase
MVASLTSPVIRLGRLSLILVELLLLVGVAANYLDELKGRPWRTDIPSRVLWCVGLGSLGASSVIGLYLTLQVGPWFIAFVAVWGFVTASYSLELFGGRFHSAASLGFVVASALLGASLVNDMTVTWAKLLVAVFGAMISGYGRQHYEFGKASGKDRMALHYPRRVWRWLMLEIVVINVVAAVALISRISI